MEGWLIEGNKIVGKVDPENIDPAWRAPEVIEALVSVCGDPTERAAVCVDGGR